MKNRWMVATLLGLLLFPVVPTQTQASSAEIIKSEMAQIHRLMFTVVAYPEGEWADSEIKSIESRTEHDIQALLVKNGFELVQYVEDAGTAPALDLEIRSHSKTSF